jgi:hypothetical protein
MRMRRAFQHRVSDWLVSRSQSWVGGSVSQWATDKTPVSFPRPSGQLLLVLIMPRERLRNPRD